MSRSAIPSVSIPGPTQLARTPNRPSSAASARTRLSIAAFGPDDKPSRTGNRWVAAVVTATRLPEPCPGASAAAARRCGSAGCATAKNPPTSWSTASRSCAGRHLAQVELRHRGSGRVHEGVHAAELRGGVVDERARRGVVDQDRPSTRVRATPERDDVVDDLLRARRVGAVREHDVAARVPPASGRPRRRARRCHR